MKIETVESIAVDRFLYVQISTDTGLGEAGMWGCLGANEAVIRDSVAYR